MKTPKVKDAPKRIWLVYGELEHDDTHEECVRLGEVTWCEDKQFSGDVEYVRADLVTNLGDEHIPLLRRCEKNIWDDLKHRARQCRRWAMVGSPYCCAHQPKEKP